MLKIGAGIAIVLLTFIELTHTSPLVISQALNEVSDIERLLTDSSFVKQHDELIYSGVNNASTSAKKALDGIQKLGQLPQIPSSIQKAVNVAIEGVLETIRIITSSGIQANNALDQALKLVKNQQVEAAIDSLKKGLSADRELVFISGVPVHAGQGAALALSGGAAFDGLKKTIVCIQNAGSVIFEALEVANEIANLGIKAGGSAAETAFEAAKKTIAAGVSANYTDLTKAAKEAVKGLLSAFSNGIIKANNAEGVIDSLKTSFSTDNPQALEAINRLDKNLTSASKISTNKNTIVASKVIQQGLASTILETADAISVAKKALSAAGKLAESDPKAAIDLVRQGIMNAEEELLSGSAPGYLALGAAGQLVGEKAAQALVPCVIEIEYGRVSAFEELALAERTALIGIRTGGEAIAEGIEAAKQICDTAGAILYQDYADSGEIGFDALKSF